jgi:hypothetical protein
VTWTRGGPCRKERRRSDTILAGTLATPSPCPDWGCDGFEGTIAGMELRIKLDPRAKKVREGNGDVKATA